jgi:hypothetical protein
VPPKKNHHFVPQLILRRFSADERTVSLHHFGSRRTIVDTAPISDQCSQDYFYGRDPALEDSFGFTEGKFSQLLQKLESCDFGELPLDDRIAVILFTHYQRNRTAAAADKVNNQNEALLKDLAAQNPDTADIDPASYRIKFDYQQILALKAAGDATLLTADLEVKFLVNDRKMGFVISDAAVAGYNQFAEHHPLFTHWRGYSGVASKGLQWFYPISPRVCIAVYDPTTYCYGSPKSRVCRPSSRDVEFLNSLQAIHARECLYFLTGTVSDGEIDRMRGARERHPNLYETRVVKSPPYRRPDGLIGQIMSPVTPDPRLGFQPNFSRVVDDNPYDGYDRAILPVRSPELMKLAEQEWKRRAGEERNATGDAAPESGERGPAG